LAASGQDDADELFKGCASPPHQAKRFGTSAAAPYFLQEQTHVKLIRLWRAGTAGHEIAVFFELQDGECIRLHVLDPNLGEAAWVAKNEVWKYLAAEWIADAYFGLYRKYDFKFEYRIVIPAGSAPPRSKLSEIFEPPPAQS
jgi:hypothetical protein